MTALRQPEQKLTSLNTADEKRERDKKKEIFNEHMNKRQKQLFIRHVIHKQTVWTREGTHPAVNNECTHNDFKSKLALLIPAGTVDQWQSLRLQGKLERRILLFFPFSSRSDY